MTVHFLFDLERPWPNSQVTKESNATRYIDILILAVRD